MPAMSGFGVDEGVCAGAEYAASRSAALAAAAIVKRVMQASPNRDSLRWPSSAVQALCPTENSIPNSDGKLDDVCHGSTSHTSAKKSGWLVAGGGCGARRRYGDAGRTDASDGIRIVDHPMATGDRHRSADE